MFTLHQPARGFTFPKFVGHWLIGGATGLRLFQARKPRWLTRVLCRWLLEWQWRDEVT